MFIGSRAASPAQCTTGKAASAADEKTPGRSEGGR